MSSISYVTIPTSAKSLRKLVGIIGRTYRMNDQYVIAAMSGARNLRSLHGKPWMGSTNTSCGEAYGYAKDTDYGSADAYARSEVATDLHLGIREESGNWLWYKFGDTAKFHKQHVLMNHSRKLVYVSGEDSWSHTDTSTMPASVPVESEGSGYWECKAHVNADTAHTANSECYLDATITFLSEHDGTTLGTAMVRSRARVRSEG